MADAAVGDVWPGAGLCSGSPLRRGAARQHRRRRARLCPAPAEIGARDDGYIDAYYGPPEVRAAATANPRSIEELGVSGRGAERPAARRSRRQAAVGQRQAFLDAQLTAAATRLRMLRGERLSFAEEARGLYGVDLEGLLHPLSHYDPILARIERLVPGDGPLADRVEAFLARFTIPARAARRGDARRDRRMPAADGRPYSAAARRGLHAGVRHQPALVRLQLVSGQLSQPHPGQHRSAGAAQPRGRSRLPRRLSRPSRLQHAARAESRPPAGAGSSSSSIRSTARRASSPRAAPIMASRSPFRAASGCNTKRACSIRSRDCRRRMRPLMLRCCRRSTR